MEGGEGRMGEERWRKKRFGAPGPSSTTFRAAFPPSVLAKAIFGRKAGQGSMWAGPQSSLQSPPSPALRMPANEILCGVKAASDSANISTKTGRQPAIANRCDMTSRVGALGAPGMLEERQ